MEEKKKGLKNPWVLERGVGFWFSSTSFHGSKQAGGRGRVYQSSIEMMKSAIYWELGNFQIGLKFCPNFKRRTQKIWSY